MEKQQNLSNPNWTACALFFKQRNFTNPLMLAIQNIIVGSLICDTSIPLNVVFKC